MGGRSVLLSVSAMLVSGGRVLFSLVVLTGLVMVCRLMMMGGGVMVSGCLMVMLARRMLRRLGHFRVLPGWLTVASSLSVPGR